MRTAPTEPFSLDGRAWRLLACFGVLLVAALLALTVARQQWAMTASLVIFLVAGCGILLIRKLPSSLALLLVLVALLNGAGGTFDWFETHAWFDELAHTYGGFAGLAAIGYLYARGSAAKQARLVWWCTGMGLLLGIGWEMVEGAMGDLEFYDTASDIVLDTVGAALGGLCARQALRAAEGTRHPRGAEEQLG